MAAWQGEGRGDGGRGGSRGRSQAAPPAPQAGQAGDGRCVGLRLALGSRPQGREQVPTGRAPVPAALTAALELRARLPPCLRHPRRPTTSSCCPRQWQPAWRCSSSSSGTEVTLAASRIPWLRTSEKCPEGSTSLGVRLWPPEAPGARGQSCLQSASAGVCGGPCLGGSPCRRRSTCRASRPCASCGGH